MSIELSVFEEPPSVPSKITERHMLDALNRRYTSDSGNGDRWIRAEHVRNQTGFGHADPTGQRKTTLRPRSMLCTGTR